MKQWRPDPRLEMVSFNNIKHKPIGSSAPPLIKKWGIVPTCTTDKDDASEVVGCKTSGIPAPWLPFFLES